MALTKEQKAAGKNLIALLKKESALLRVLSRPSGTRGGPTLDTQWQYDRLRQEIRQAERDIEAIATPTRFNPSAKRSTLSGAGRLYRKFIGKTPGEVTRTPTRHQAAASAPGGKLPVAVLARLRYLKIRNPAARGGKLLMIRFKDGERPKLDSHAKGRQYYFVGGNQDLAGLPPMNQRNPPQVTAAALRRAGLESYSAGLIPMGEVHELGYDARKWCDDFRPVQYFHEHGEENGRRPVLLYDPKQRQMHLVGGDYRTLANGVNN
jgi:hypothetical protein